jgi:hypothetical protein
VPPCRCCPKKTFRANWSEDTKLTPVTNRLRTYTGEAVNILGEKNVTVCCNGREEKLPVAVVAESDPDLIGRDWLRHIRLNWDQILHLQGQSPLSNLL